MADQTERSAGPVAVPSVWRAIVLVVWLSALWLGLSGNYAPLLLGLGAVSVAFCTLVAWRLGLIDAEGHPYDTLPRAVVYWAWLAVQIYKSAVDVARLVLRPKLQFRPVLLPVPATQRNDLGHVVYANSITLTPGTVSIDLEPGSVLVHALTEVAAAELRGGDMDRRVTRAFGGT